MLKNLMIFLALDFFHVGYYCFVKVKKCSNLNLVFSTDVISKEEALALLKENKLTQAERGTS